MSRVGGLNLDLGITDSDVDAVLARNLQRAKAFREEMRQTLSIPISVGDGGANFGMNPGQRAEAGPRNRPETPDPVASFQSSRDFYRGDVGDYFPGGAPSPARGSRSSGGDVGSLTQAINRLTGKINILAEDATPSTGDEGESPAAGGGGGGSRGFRIGARFAAFFAVREIAQVVGAQRDEQVRAFMGQLYGPEADLRSELGRGRQLMGGASGQLRAWLAEGSESMLGGRSRFNDEANYRDIQESLWSRMQDSLRIQSGADLFATSQRARDTGQSALQNRLAAGLQGYSSESSGADFAFSKAQTQSRFQIEEAKKKLADAQKWGDKGDIQKAQQSLDDARRDQYINMQAADDLRRSEQAKTLTDATREIRTMASGVPSLQAIQGGEAGRAGELKFSSDLQDKFENTDPALQSTLKRIQDEQRGAHLAVINEDIGRREASIRSEALRYGRNYLGSDLMNMDAQRLEELKNARYGSMTFFGHTFSYDERPGINQKADLAKAQRLQEEGDRDDRIQLGLSGQSRRLSDQLADPLNTRPQVGEIDQLLAGGESDILGFVQAGKTGPGSFAEQARGNLINSLKLSQREYRLGFRATSFDRQNVISPRDMAGNSAVSGAFADAFDEAGNYLGDKPSTSPPGAGPNGAPIKIDPQTITDIANQIAAAIARNVAP